MEYSFEIDFLPVGNGERSGDAIALRYKLLNATDFKVVVVDGGTLESGKALVEHVSNVYNTTQVDLAINTHPDNDHCSGLREVLNNLEVKRLWMHRPWNYSHEFLDTFKDGKLTASSLQGKLKEALDNAHELASIAIEKGIPIEDPLQGLSFDDGVIRVLGPSEEYYKVLVSNFRRTPGPKESLLQKSLSAIKEAVEWVKESMSIETLKEDSETSAENNSSVITLLSLGNKSILLTGDSGVPALQKAISYASSLGISLKNLNFIQVPHHGSRRNVSPSVLNNMMGNTAFVSAAVHDEHHPRKKVTNAFIRRGAKVYQTKGQNLRHHNNMEPRQGYGPATPIDFSELVEN